MKCGPGKPLASFQLYKTNSYSVKPPASICFAARVKNHKCSLPSS